MSSEHTPELKTAAAKLQPVSPPMTRPLTGPLTCLDRKLKATLRRLGVTAQSNIVVGVSGGADSMALLDALIRLRQRTGVPGVITGAHVNHQLRGAASELDMQFVQNWAAARKVAVVTAIVDVAELAHASKRNLEAVGRETRYRHFQQVAIYAQAQFVCTAHTFDDQVETLLLRLLRGTGAAGLRGIHEVSDLAADVQLLRPLLNVTRAEVLAHCAQYSVEFRTDETNASEKFTRNRVRHTLLPLLRSFNPQIGVALTRTAAGLREDDECLQQQAAELLQQAEEGARLRLTPLKTSHPALHKRVLRLWLWRECGATGRTDAVHLEALSTLITRGQGGSVIELPGGWRVVREAAWLRLWQAEPASCAEKG